MHTVHRSTGFTLVETLVSTLIAALMLGAVSSTSHVITRSAQISQSQAEMGAFADEMLTQVEILQNMGATNNIDFLNITFSGATEQAPHYGMIQMTPDKKLVWVPYDTSYGYDNAQPGPNQTRVCPAGGKVECASTSMYNLANGPFRGVAPPVTSLIAVATSVGAANIYYRNGPNPGTVDPTEYSTDPGQRLILNSTPGWKYYEVSLRGYPIFTQTNQTKFSLDAGQDVDGATLTNLQANSYRLLVTLTNYADPTQTLTRSAILTDWQKK